MTSFLSRVNMATKAAFDTWRRVYSDPQSAQSSGAFQNRAAYYDRLWRYYSNSVFEKISAGDGQWARYTHHYGLYRHTRSIYNPTNRLTEFYVGRIYPGVLSEDGKKLPTGIPLAIPLARDTPTPLKTAIAQVWQWSNWQEGKGEYIRFGATTGNVLVEVVDDVESGKVYLSNTWPGMVADLVLDAMGNVKAYTLEYETEDENGKMVVYRKEVTQEAIKTFKDDAPQTNDKNPYGFAPAIWARHKKVGGDYGECVIQSSIPKVDELNSIASHVHDQIHIAIEPLTMVAGATNQTLRLLTDPDTAKRGSTHALADPNATRESIRIFTAPPGTTTQNLTGNFDPEKAGPEMERLIKEIENDHPELTMYQKMAEMSTLTGPAANRLLGNVAELVTGPAASYDRGSIALFQMAVAIGGWRAQNGDWGSNLTRQQAKFLPYNLDSYKRGDLDFDIMPRPLVTPTGTERADEAMKWATALGLWVDAGQSARSFFEIEREFDAEQLGKLGETQTDTPASPLEMGNRADAQDGQPDAESDGNPPAPIDEGVSGVDQLGL